MAFGAYPFHCHPKGVVPGIPGSPRGVHPPRYVPEDEAPLEKTVDESWVS